MSVESSVEMAPLQLVEPPPRLYVPLVTHGAVERTPYILIGGTPAKGQLLADALAEAGPAALAPTSGRILGTSTITLTNGQNVPAVELQPDFQDRGIVEEHDAYKAEHHRELLDSLDKVTGDDLGQWIDRLRDQGVWADRLMSPDLLAQLHQILRRPVDTIICNLVDHDPQLRLQGTLAAKFGAVLLAGVTLMAKLTSARNVWIAVQAGVTPKWWLTLRREIRKAGVEIVPVLADYPQADPTLLVYTLLRRRLRPGRSPVEQGVLLFDGVSAVAVGRAATREKPMLETPVAVRDHIRGKSHLLVVPIGTPVRHVLEKLQIPHEGVTILRGDMLKDQPIDQSTVLAGGELHIHVMPQRTEIVPDPCVRCGWCAQVCPTVLQPAGVLEAAQRGDQDMGDFYGLDACIECGLCSYFCPSKLPLLNGIRTLKKLRKE